MAATSNEQAEIKEDASAVQFQPQVCLSESNFQLSGVLLQAFVVAVKMLHRLLREETSEGGMRRSSRS